MRFKIKKANVLNLKARNLFSYAAYTVVGKAFYIMHPNGEPLGIRIAHKYDHYECFVVLEKSDL